MPEKRLANIELMAKQARSEIVTWWCELKNFEAEGPFEYFQRIESIRDTCLVLGINAFNEETDEFLWYLADPKILYKKFNSAAERLIILSQQLERELENVHPLSEVFNKLRYRANQSYVLSKMIRLYLNQNILDDEV